MVTPSIQFFSSGSQPFNCQMRPTLDTVPSSFNMIGCTFVTMPLSDTSVPLTMILAPMLFTHSPCIVSSVIGVVGAGVSGSGGFSGSGGETISLCTLGCWGSVVEGSALSGPQSYPAMFTAGWAAFDGDAFACPLSLGLQMEATTPPIVLVYKLTHLTALVNTRPL